MSERGYAVELAAVRPASRPFPRGWDDWLWLAVAGVSALTRRVEGGRADWLTCLSTPSSPNQIAVPTNPYIVAAGESRLEEREILMMGESLG